MSAIAEPGKLKVRSNQCSLGKKRHARSFGVLHLISILDTFRQRHTIISLETFPNEKWTQVSFQLDSIAYLYSALSVEAKVGNNLTVGRSVYSELYLRNIQRSSRSLQRTTEARMS